MSELPIMRRYPVPGTVVKEWVIPAREYAAFEMQRGQVLRFVDVEGKQVPDVACFNLHDLTEHLNLGNSLLLNKRREFRQRIGKTFDSISGTKAAARLIQSVGFLQ